MTRRSTRPLRLLAASAALGAAMVAPLPASLPVGGASAGAATTDPCGDLVAKADGTLWSCTFVDQFDGSEIDENKWLVVDTSWSGFRTGLTCFKASTRNVTLRHGALRLITRDEGREFTCKSPTGDFRTRYTGGHVSTRGGFSQTYGRFEVRAQYPVTRTAGVHGAFWLYPAKHTYGAWPASGEIDVAEWWSSEPQLVLPSLHYPGRDFFLDSGWNCRTVNVSEFHTYTVEWSAQEMQFFIDGTLCFSRVWEPDSPLVFPQPFDHPFELILTMGVGGASGLNPVSSTTELPGTYVVDYVKAWR